MKLTTVTNFINLFWHYLHPHWHIALRFDSGYAAIGVNNAEKYFMKLILVAIFTKLFWCNLYPQWHIAISFDSGYATTGVNHTEKIVNEIDNWDQFHKPFLALFTPPLAYCLKF